MEHRRLRILFATIALFAFGVVIWYFLFSTPKSAPTLETTANPLPILDLPARFGFVLPGKNAPATTTTETEVTSPEEEPLILVWNKPTAGNTFVTKQILKEVAATSTVGTTTVTTNKTVRATTTVLMFVDRETGYLYGYSLDSHSTYQITNTTLPGIHDAYIWSNGTKVLLRYLDTDRETIISLLADIPSVQPGHTPEPLSRSSLLQKGVTSVAVSASSNSLSYLVPTSNGSSIYTMTGKGVARADSPFSEWRLFYGGEQLFATANPSAYLEGSTYVLPSFARVVGEKTGLASIGAGNGTLLNSMWAQDGVRSFIVEKGLIRSLPIRTIASKCAGSILFFICGVPKSIPDDMEGYPDDWYQGRAEFDDIVMLVTSSGESSILYSFDEKVGKMDMTHISLTPKTDLISFIRKQSGSLYLLNTTLLDNE